jgi:hypothetical protein
MKKIVFFRFSTSLNMKKKFTLSEIKYYIDSLVNMKMDLDSLPDELDDYKNEINELIFHPGAKAGAECCGTGCINCVQNTNEKDVENFDELLNNFIVRINLI